jgi:hypothetical protein
MTLQIPRAITSIRQNERALKRMSRWMTEPEIDASPRRHRQLLRLSKAIRRFEKPRYDHLFYTPTEWEMMEFRLENLNIPSTGLDADSVRAYLNGEITTDQLIAKANHE